MTAVKDKILLVEDEEDLARLFEIALAREGLKIRRVHDAPAGLEAFRRWRPDLVLLDVVLPGMCGLDLLELLRRESRVPVILISGRRRPADLQRGETLGAEGYLVKPFALDELRERVKRALSRGGNGNGRAAPGPARNSPARRPAARSVRR